MPAGRLQALLLDEAHRTMTGLSDDDEDRQLTSIPEPVRAIWLLSWLEFEVSQGALLAYFFNRHGRHAMLAVDVLRRVGADQMAVVLAEAQRLHSSGAAEWTARQQELSGLGAGVVTRPYADLPGATELDRLTGRFWEAADLDRWGDKLDAYLQEQVAHLADRSI